MSKPDFKSYSRSLWGLILNDSAGIGDRIWSFADRSLLLFGQLPIVAVVWFIYAVSPFAIYDEWVMKIVALMIGVLMLAAYWLVFVYRFGRFAARWADAAAHPDVPAAENCDIHGFLLDNKENQISERKSRARFVMLAAAAALMAGYALLGWGLAPQLLYTQHKAQLDKVAEILVYADDVNIYPAQTNNHKDIFIGAGFPYEYSSTTGKEQLSDAEIEELSALLSKMGKYYITGVFKDGQNNLTVQLGCSLGMSSELVWFGDNSGNNILKQKGWIELDDHWWLSYDS